MDLKAEIQAYMDAHNIRSYTREVRAYPGNKYVAMAERLEEINGWWYYIYDGLVDTAFRVLPDGRLEVRYDVARDWPIDHPLHGEPCIEESLAHHFHRLDKEMELA